MIVLESLDPDTFNCQRRVATAIARCGTIRLRNFNRCKKQGVGGSSPTIQSGLDLEEQCLMQEGDPTTGQPDPKEKIARACSRDGLPVEKDRILKEMNKHCVSGVDPAVAFPACPGGFSWFSIREQCFVPRATCRFCLAVVGGDNLSRDCDLFDNGVADASCPP